MESYQPITEVRNCTLLVAALVILIGCGFAGSAQGETSAGDLESRLVGAWELIYWTNDKGEQQLPTNNSRTFLEFTDKGEVVFTGIGPRDPGTAGLKSGTYRLDNDEISVTDGTGQTAKWSYTVADDVLRVGLPEKQGGLYWRRLPPERMPTGRLSGHIDKNLLGTWELLYRINSQGQQELPTEGMITRLGFTDKGEAILSRIEPNKQGEVMTKSGTFALVKDEIVIKDESEQEVKWPYKVVVDTLTIDMTAPQMKVIWRRVKTGTTP